MNSPKNVLLNLHHLNRYISMYIWIWNDFRSFSEYGTSFLMSKMSILKLLRIKAFLRELLLPKSIDYSKNKGEKWIHCENGSKKL